MWSVLLLIILLPLQTICLGSMNGRRPNHLHTLWAYQAAEGGGGTDYTQDANCVQSFILDDGTADSSDRTGSNDLVLADGAWAGSNDGYIFDADATGAFTPTLTTWQGADSTVAILTTVDNVAEHIIFNVYMSGDVNRRMFIGTLKYAVGGRYDGIDARYGRQYGASAEYTSTTDTAGAKQWVFVTYDTSETELLIYRDGVDKSAINTDDGEYGTMTIDTGQLGNGSSHTIYQVGIFTRILTSGEMTEIVATGLTGS